jgi:predicted Zn-dependent protease
VLAHEIGHVTARHHNDRIVQQLGVQLVGAGLQVAGAITDEQAFNYAGLATQVGGGLAVMKWGRDDEHQSDELGLKYMVEAGYNPRGMVQLMKVLHDAGGGRSAPEWLSTHPTPKSRIDELEQMIADRYPNATTSNGFGYYEDRFERQALSVLRDLPPAPQPQGQGQ